MIQSAATRGLGWTYKQVQVREIIPAKNLASCIDTEGQYVEVTTAVRRSDTALSVGQTWIIDREFGRWTFNALVATDAAGARPMTSKTPDWINVKNVGAVGDGIVDDTEAINRAIGLGPVVYFPAGTYLTSTVNVSAGTVLVGDAPGGFTTPVPETQMSTLKLKPGTNGHLIYGADGTAQVQIRYLHLDGNKAANSAGSGIHIADKTSIGQQQANWFITDTYIENAAQDGIYVGAGRLAAKMQRVSVYGVGQNGINIQAPDAGLDTCMIGLSGQDGIYLGANAWVAHINHCDVWSSEGVGINASEGPSMVTLTGVGIDRHKHQGVLVGGGVMAITGCLFHSNSQASNAAYAHIRMDAGRLSVTSTTFGTDGLSKNPNYAIEHISGSLRESGNLFATGTATAYMPASALKRGTVTLVGGTANVSTIAVASDSVIMLTAQGTGGTPGNLTVSSRSAGASFTITSSSGTDTRPIGWAIMPPV